MTKRTAIKNQPDPKLPHLATRVKLHLEVAITHPSLRLVEAVPVEEGSTCPDLPMAEPDEGRIQATGEDDAMFSDKTQILLLAGGFLLLVSFGIFLMTRNGNTSERMPRPTTMASSHAPTLVPSSAPTDVLSQLLDELPPSTIDQLSEHGTPQWKAWDWLVHHQNITNLPEWRKKQLFVMATFFYALEGEHWTPVIQRKWMDEEEEECLWYSSGIGYFDANGRYAEWPDYFQLEPCNDMGELTHLEIYNLGLAGRDPYIPPEIALLPHLQNIFLGESDLEVPLENLHPTELGQLPKFLAIGLHDNNIVGTIPTHIAMFTNLEDIFFLGNSLTGSLPTELGLLTKLTQLDFSRNPYLIGTIPSKITLLNDLGGVNFTGTNLTGKIPEELCYLEEPTCTFVRLNWVPNATDPCFLEFDCGMDGLCGCSCPCET
jgi:hypothetical protein